MANYKVLRGFTYFPEGVEPSDANLPKTKSAEVGDVVGDLTEDDVKGHLRYGNIEATSARASSEPSK